MIFADFLLPGSRSVSLKRIRIRLTKMKRTQTDPVPQHCVLLSGNRTTYPLGIGPLIIWESGHFLGNGTFYPLGTILSSGNQTTYSLGVGPRILWESDHLSSGIRDILCETGLGNRDTLSSGNRTTYPLGNILWESGIGEMRYNRIPH